MHLANSCPRVTNLVQKQNRQVGCACRLATVGLVDAHLCTDAGKYLSALLLSLSSMLHLELPHVNVLSKADMVEAYRELSFNLEYFTEVRLTPSVLPLLIEAMFSLTGPFHQWVQSLCRGCSHTPLS